MNEPFQESNLRKIAEGDLTTLSEFDRHGFIIGSQESPQDFANRLRIFQKNLNDMQDQLTQKKVYTVEKMPFPENERIPQSTFEPASKITEELYDFKINWVPGFFVTPAFGMLFGGCAFSFHPDFFSLFIIRNSFKTKNKWLIYGRDELMSHELCHVARFALNSQKYEEQFAYQTSTSSFRKKFGSIFRSAWETYLLMILLITLMVTQVSLVLFKGPWLASRSIIENPINWIYLTLFSFITILVARQVKQNKDFQKALTNLANISPNPRALAFRLSDNELDQIVQQTSLTEEICSSIINPNNTNESRFQTIKQRFFHKK